jgi:hypothetical protein
MSTFDPDALECMATTVEEGRFMTAALTRAAGIVLAAG